MTHPNAATLVCPLCSAANHHLAVVCRSCHGFLQAKVDTLDLFATMWKVIEEPQAAFRRIAIARHKNHAILLASVAGIGMAFLLLWATKVGDTQYHLVEILALGVLSGLMLGAVIVALLSALQLFVARILGLKARFKNVFAVTAYASVPIVFTVVLLLPIEVMTFGKYFFSTNPSPHSMKPFSYVILMGLDGVFVIWAVCLYLLGVKVLHGVGLGRAALISGASLGVVVGMVLFGLAVVGKPGKLKLDWDKTVAIAQSHMQAGFDGKRIV